MAAERIQDLDTPVAIVDVAKLEANLTRMSQTLASLGTGHRPHTKSHKTRQIAERQLAHGAHGLTVAKVGEAEAMVAAGFDDLLIAYPVFGDLKYERMLPLMDRAKLRIAVDSPDAVAAAGAFFAARGRELEVLVEYDGGAGRSGTQTVEEALAIGRLVEATAGLQLVGVMSYGNAYGTTDLAEQHRIGTAEGADAVAVAAAFATAGLPAGVVSVGSTPTAKHAAAVDGVTEIRAGVYAFQDLKQTTLGVATIDDCALTVLTTVVSHPRPDRYVLDAGIKALAGEDYGWGTNGRILEHPDLIINRATEEHGIVILGEDAVDPGWRIGDKVRIVPNHACGTANMHDVLVAVDDEHVVDRWDVIGRGRVR